MSKKSILILVLVLSLTASFAVARKLEQPLPGEEAPTTTETALPEYLVYVFRFSMMTAGLVAFGVLAYGGFRYLISGGNPPAIAAARKQMLGGAIGLALLLASFLVLVTIHPQFIEFEGKDENEVKPTQGVCFYSEQGAKGERYCFNKSTKKIPDGFNPKSLEFESTKDKLLSVYTFSSEGWVAVQKRYDNERESYDDDPYVYPEKLASPKSFFIDWNEPGIYLYKGVGYQPDFPNHPYQVHKSSVSSLEDYNNDAGAIRFRNSGCTKIPGPNPDEDYYHPEVKYGAILHTEPDFRGKCGIAFGDPADSEDSHHCCTDRELFSLANPSSDYLHPIGNNELSSITIFNHHCFGHPTGKVIFYDQINHSGNSFEVKADQIGKFWTDLNVSYPFHGLDKILSFKIEGSLMVILTTGHNLNSDCEVFKKTTKSLKEHYIIPNLATKVHSIAIIPLKE